MVLPLKNATSNELLILYAELTKAEIRAAH